MAGTISLLFNILNYAPQIQFQSTVARVAKQPGKSEYSSWPASSLLVLTLTVQFWAYSDKRDQETGSVSGLQKPTTSWAMHGLFGPSLRLFPFAPTELLSPTLKITRFGSRSLWPWKWRSAQSALAWHCPLSCRQRSRGSCSGSQSSPSPT